MRRDVLTHPIGPIVALAAFAWLAGLARGAVTADNLLLIVNKQQPAGRQIAERYAELRHVPADRIVEIDVPDRDDVPVEIYDSAIAGVVRDQIAARNLRRTVTCLVTFYGVPLRVRDRLITPAERIEASDIIDPLLGPVRGQLATTVESLEAIARDADATYQPLTLSLDVAEQIRSRGAHAERAIRAAIAQGSDANHKAALDARLTAALHQLGEMPQLPHMPAPPVGPTTQPADPRMGTLLAQPGNAESRRALREMVYGQGNVIGFLSLLETQRAYLTSGSGEASVDSELSCLFLGPNYPRSKWLPNPFHYAGRSAQLRAGVIRTARIDGPTPAVAQRIVDESVAVEATGLKGDVVLDARGMPDGQGVVGAYNTFDESIRSTAKLLVGVADLPVTLDNAGPLLPDHTSAHAAIYCGWYQLRRYTPTVHSVPGGIAVHVASFEMISLHAPAETGWCRGLLSDGADVTLGAVGEPYLFAFPPADEFIGLILTGKPTLVEAYWATIAVTSWKLVLIGDPLYRPFAHAPAITIDRLPAALKTVGD